MASFKCFVPLMLCVLLATLCIASAKPVGEESDKKSVKTALSDEAIKAKLTAQLRELEKDVDDFLKKIDQLDSELDTITDIPDDLAPTTAKIAEESVTPAQV